MEIERHQVPYYSPIATAFRKFIERQPNHTLDREHLRYMCDRCKTTVGTMFITKLGRCVCVSCSLIPYNSEPVSAEGAD